MPAPAKVAYRNLPTGTTASTVAAGDDSRFMGTSGSSYGDVTVTAGETLAARDAVFIALSGNNYSYTAGRAYKADANNTYMSTEAVTFGFAVAAITSGSTGTIRIVGTLGGFSGLTVGKEQFISATAGAITETAPSNARRVAIALATDTLLIYPQMTQPIPSVGPPLATIKGYALGGYSGAYVATADKLTYSTDVTSAQASANLSQARNEVTGLAEGDTKGYALGGSTGAKVATADKIVYSTDTTAAQTTANLSTVRGTTAHDGVATTAKGYVLGGQSGSGTYTAVADKVTYSTDTTAAQTSANLSQARQGPGGITEWVTKGYALGGYSGSYVATADKLTFSTDTTAAQTTANLSTIRGWAHGLTEGTTKGYTLGGINARTATADKLTFSTDTTAAQTTANLSQARDSVSAVTEGSSKGYAMGGNTGATRVVTADKVTFSTDTTAAQTSANLSQLRDPAGVGRY